MPWTTSCLALALAALAQQDDPAVARFRYPDGREGRVDRAELARDVGARHRRGENGAEALRVLVDRELVAIEARAAGIEPTQQDVDACVAGIRAQVESAGASLDDFLSARRMTRADFERNFVRFQVAHQRLVMRAVDLDDPAEVTPELQQLWLEEARGRHRVVTEESKLPPGMVAVVDDRRFDLADLGRELLPNVPDEEIDKHLRRIVLRELLRARAEAADIKVTEADTRAEIEARRARIESDPRYRGVSYADWLRTTQGLTVDELARSPQMVATVQQERLCALAFPRAELERRLREDREAVLRAHGERRAISVILLRALEKPNEIVRRSFEAAREEVARLREELDGNQDFGRLARIHSEDPHSKVRGGALGEFTRGADDVPDPVLAAAFAMQPLEVSAPIRVPQGFCLVRVTKVIPAPDEPELLEALREELAQGLLAEMLEAAAIEVLGRDT
jgi:parvulin-like peptidyl-prolyl isomerase